LNATQKYLKECEAFASLPRRVLRSSEPRHGRAFSLCRLAKHNFRSILNVIKSYPAELWRGRASFLATSKLHRSRRARRALVIGNGPSQGFLRLEHLEMFKREGGETICVNRWNVNNELSMHIPSWMVFSDRDTFINAAGQPDEILGYLKQNTSIKVVIPTSLLPLMQEYGITNEIYCFIDTELSISSNINPLFPRGYISMTLYKALAWAIFLEYSEIGVIGMDNTYAKTLYNDSLNRVCNVESHAGGEDYLSDQSELFATVADLMEELTLLFRHLEYFPNENIVNLDQHSMTDRFPKVPLEQFFES